MGHRILLADDSLTIQKVVELTFSGPDWELKAVGSGEKALALLGEFAPEVVLADAVMPGLTGYELCEAVKKLPDGRFIPVVMMTGTFEPFDRSRAERAGADAVVTKPFDSHALQSTVADLVARAVGARAAEPPPPPPLPEAEPTVPEAGEAAVLEEGERTAPLAAPEPHPDALYATTAIPVFASEPPGEPVVPAVEPPPPAPEAAPPLPEPPEPFREVEAAVPPSPSGAEGAPAPVYEMDLGGLEEGTPHRDIEADIEEFERLGRVSGSAPVFGGAGVPLSEAETAPVEIEPPVPQIPEAAGSDLEVLAARTSLNDLTRLVGATQATERPLNDDDVERIARRVVEILGERVVRKVAWDVVPEMAERLVRERLRELEQGD